MLRTGDALGWGQGSLSRCYPFVPLAPSTPLPPSSSTSLHAPLSNPPSLPFACLQSHLQMLVLDEADLLLSYGYEEDLQLIALQV